MLPPFMPWAAKLPPSSLEARSSLSHSLGAVGPPKYRPEDSVLTPSQPRAAEFVYPGLELTDSSQPGAAELLPPSQMLPNCLYHSLFMWR